MKTQTVDEWRDEATERFGDDASLWAFQCPHCGYVTCVAEWIELGARPDEATQKCIGRKIPESRGDWWHPGYTPCDWAAFGLFGTLGRGRRVEQDGRVMEIFDFPGTGRPYDVLDFIDRAFFAGSRHMRTRAAINR